MRTYLSALAAAVVLSLTAPVPTQAQDVKVIVNAANAVAELPAGDVASLFLKRVQKLPGGGAAVPEDQAKNSPVRGAFSQTVLGRPAAVDAYWQRQIFAGGKLPPAVKASDDDVVAFVKATPGAIGYVSAGASVSGVKVVTIK